MLDGDRQLLTDLAAPREDRVRPLHAEADVPADELEIAVPPQHAGEQADLAQDLEAVADPEHRAAVCREAPHGVHHRPTRAIAPQRR